MWCLLSATNTPIATIAMCHLFNHTFLCISSHNIVWLTTTITYFQAVEFSHHIFELIYFTRLSFWNSEVESEIWMIFKFNSTDLILTDWDYESECNDLLN